MNKASKIGKFAGWINLLIFAGLILLIIISPLPLGSNREWSWSLCATYAATLGIIWALVNFNSRTLFIRVPIFVIVGLFSFAIIWSLVQLAAWVPEAWKHPLWQMAGVALNEELSGAISLSNENGWTAILRLLSYALVFFLALQLGRDSNRARMAFLLISLAGLAYAIFGLYVFWSGNTPVWLFADKQLGHDVRSTFVNRNHFVTWQGLTLLCAIAWFYQKLTRPVVMPYFIPKNRDDQVADFLLQSWKPLIAILLMVTALVLTHSRGGFLSALAGSLCLFWLLDRRGVQRKALSRSTVIAALLVTSLAFHLTSDVVMQRLEDTQVSDEERLLIFNDVQLGIAANPLLGYGYGTFADAFRLFDRIESPYHYDRAHNTWLENAFELGVPAALVFYLALVGLVVLCFRGVRLRQRDWVYPATGVAVSVLVGLHATVDFSLQIPAVAFLYATIMGIACAQSFSSVEQIR